MSTLDRFRHREQAACESADSVEQDLTNQQIVSYLGTFALRGRSALASRNGDDPDDLDASRIAAEIRGFDPELKRLDRLECAAQAYLDAYDAAMIRLDDAGKEHKILDERAKRFLSGTLQTFVLRRHLRAREADSRKVREAAEIARRVFPYANFFMICLDGRITPAHINMSTAGIGGAFETPGGDYHAFTRFLSGHDGLQCNTDFEKLIGATAGKYKAFCEIFDSHIHCAAQGRRMARKGISCDDHGLRHDVLRKIEMRQSFQRYMQAQHPDNRVLSVHITFDPEKGYAYMGLETPAALGRSENIDYTETVLKELAADGVILSTEELARHDAEVRAMFEESWRSLEHLHDLRTNYADSTLQFWQAVERMQPRFEAMIRARLEAMYPAMPEDEFRQRAAILLTSAFSGFCNNHTGTYPYAEHDETGIAIAHGDLRPFPDTLAVVYPDEATVADDSVLPTELVRTNRMQGRVRSEEYYPDPKEFAQKAPVPMFIKEVVRTELTEEEWRMLESIDWNFIQTAMPNGHNWSTMSNDRFSRFVTARFPKVPAGVLEHLNNLRAVMRALYQPEKIIAQDLVNGENFPLPMLTDPNRGPRVFLPFFLRGFPEKNPTRTA